MLKFSEHLNESKAVTPNSKVTVGYILKNPAKPLVSEYTTDGCFSYRGGTSDLKITDTRGFLVKKRGYALTINVKKSEFEKLDDKELLSDVFDFFISNKKEHYYKGILIESCFEDTKVTQAFNYHKLSVLPKINNKDVVVGKITKDELASIVYNNKHIFWDSGSNKDMTGIVYPLETMYGSSRTNIFSYYTETKGYEHVDKIHIEYGRYIIVLL